MKELNLIASVCSIIGLLVSLFVASKVNKLSKSNNDNSGVLQSGDGIQNIAKGDSMIVGAHGSGTYHNYKGAKINGKIDNPPVLTEKTYYIAPVDYLKYKQGVSDNSCNMVVPGKSNSMCFIVDFSHIESKPEENRWIGYAIQSMPMYDWRSFVNEDYILKFSYIATENISNIWIEMTNKKSNKKIYKEPLALSLEEKKFQLPLGKYKTRLEDWKSVDEICFVFFPEECVDQKGSVFITDLIVSSE